MAPQIKVLKKKKSVLLAFKSVYLLFPVITGWKNIHWVFTFCEIRGAGDILCILKWSEVKVAQSCLTLCNPMDYTVHGILQARMLGWIAVLFSRGCSQPSDWTQVSHIVGRFFTRWATREILCLLNILSILVLFTAPHPKALKSKWKQTVSAPFK